MSTDEHEAVIIGAGIAELSAALGLKRSVGIKSVVLERSPELRAACTAPSLSPDAWRALDALRIGDKLSVAYRLAKRGETGVRGLHPKVLSVRFSSRLASFTTEIIKDSSAVALLESEDGTLIRAEAVVGCDGVRSLGPQRLGLTTAIDSAQATVRLQKFADKEKKDRVPALYDTDVSWSTTHNTSEGKSVVISLFNYTNFSGLSVLAHNMKRDIITAGGRPVRYSGRSKKESAIGHAESIQTTDRSAVSLASVKYHAQWQSGRNSIGSHKGPVVLSRDAAAPNVEKGVEKRVKKRSRAASLKFGAYWSGWVEQAPRAGLLGRALDAKCSEP
ncbi:uncharacterized protein A4U43_C09F1710 [Asparagus officinalis]|uniref:FAD-binding domain-containing protein n=1 Tax=Asparagus officinalis TaxID=4686 RepID=A0A5P1E9C1_ASPOF|nr:uncharacterized protein A4U43_C09F1710 [Asparagus officinalis]